MAATRVIPIKTAPTGPSAAAVGAHARLIRAGFMQMMMIGEPRLSEFVGKYEALGYEVEVVPYVDEEAREGPGSDAGGGTNPAAGTIYVRKRAPLPGDEGGR